MHPCDRSERPSCASILSGLPRVLVLLVLLGLLHAAAAGACGAAAPCPAGGGSADGDLYIQHFEFDPTRGPVALPQQGRAGLSPDMRDLAVQLAPNGLPPEGDSPSAVRFTPDGSKIIVAHRFSRNLIVLDAATRTFLQEILVSGSVVDFDISCNGSRAVTANVFEDDASIVDLTTGAEIAVVSVGRQPGVVRISPDATTAVIGNTVDATLSVIDIATATELRRIPNAGFVGTVMVNFEPAAISLSFSGFVFADNTTLVHPDYYNNRIQIFDVTTGGTTTLSSLGSPWYISITPDGSKAVVSHGGTVRQITVVNVPARTIEKTIPIGVDLYGPITIKPDGSKAVVTVQNACRIVDLITGAVSGDISTLAVNALLTTADGNYALGVGYKGALISYATQTIVKELNNIVSTSLGAVSPAGPRAAMVATTFGEDMVVANTNGASGYIEGVIPSGAPPEGDNARTIAWTRDGSSLVAVNILSDNVSVIDPTTLSAEAIIPVGDRPSDVETTPDGSKAAVGNLDSNFLSVINLATHSVTNVTISRRASQVEISPNGTYAYVAVVADGDGVWRVNLNTLAVEGPKLTTGNMGTIYYSYAQSSGMTLSHDGATLVTCDSFDDRISIIDTGSWSVAASVPVGDFPVRATFSPDDSRIYISHRDDRTVRVVTNEGASSHVIGTVIVGQQPFEMAVSPDGGTLWVADYQDENIGVVDLSTLTMTQTIPLPEPPAGISLNEDASSLYVGTGNWTIQMGPGPLVVISWDGQFTAIDTATETIAEQTDIRVPPAMLAYNAATSTAALPSPFGDGVDMVRILAPGTATDRSAAARLLLAPPAPNPATSSVVLSFATPAHGPVALSIHRPDGGRVATLIDGVLPAGQHEAVWAARDPAGNRVAPGIYWIRLRAAAAEKTAKVLVLE